MPTYSSVIGKQFRAKEEICALGITSDRNYAKRVDYIVLFLVNGVCFSGPEVVTREKLDRGYIFKVVKIFKDRYFLSSEMAYVVEAVDSNKFKGQEVRIRLTGDIHDRNYGLDESIYSLEESAR